MQALTREQEELLGRLVELAGSPVVLQLALRELAQESADAGLEALVKKIIEVRDREAPAAASA